MKGTSRLSPIIYGYDSLYRLTSETIASDPNNINGAVNYTYDSVGNRKQITSTLAPVPAGLFNYDANDRFTAGDTYDNDGNTVSSGGIANVYDFENHLVQKGGATIVYDGDGNRVSKAVAGVTTTYLVDNLNPTGNAEVVYETFSGSSAPNRELNHVYVYGLELLGQTRSFSVNSNSTTQQIYYDYDGHGSVRALTDPNGNVTDTYDYDAFGNLIHSSTTLSSPTPNNYLYSGEQFDPDLGLYYNRARYLNTTTGRFWTMDSYEGFNQLPGSLHKYLYLTGEPINSVDPTGRSGETDQTVWGRAVHKKIFDDFRAWLASQLPPHVGFANTSIKNILELPTAPRTSPIYLRPDLADRTTHELYEIKPALAAPAGTAQLGNYISILSSLDSTSWVPGTTFSDAQEIPLGGGLKAEVFPTLPSGLILYQVVPSGNGPAPFPIVIPVSVEEVTEATIAAEERLAAQAAQAEVTETAAEAPLLQ